MSVFREATKYIHGDKLWSWNPANHLKDIEISKISTIEAGQMHFVLSIPRYKMKGNASVPASDWTVRGCADVATFV